MFEYEYSRPQVAVDCVVYFISKDYVDESILLIKRGGDPYKGMWALPGGFVEENESTKDAAIRELNEETSVLLNPDGLVGVFEEKYRDPRTEMIISVAYSFSVDEEIKVLAADDAIEAKWFNVLALPKLAFDHKLIIDTFMDNQ